MAIIIIDSDLYGDEAEFDGLTAEAAVAEAEGVLRAIDGGANGWDAVRLRICGRDIRNERGEVVGCVSD